MGGWCRYSTNKARYCQEDHFCFVALLSVVRCYHTLFNRQISIHHAIFVFDPCVSDTNSPTLSSWFVYLRVWTIDPEFIPCSPLIYPSNVISMHLQLQQGDYDRSTFSTSTWEVDSMCMHTLWMNELIIIWNFNKYNYVCI